MKKLTLFLVAMLFSALSFAALNPYAYGLSSSLNADQTTLTVNYSLNADATSATFVLLDGDKEILSQALSDITKGTYTATVNLDLPDIPVGKPLTWKIEVKGNSVTKPTKETTEHKFWGPRGLAIDTNPESEYFGRILVTESYHPVKDLTGYVSSGKGAGIYVFAPDFTTNGNVENGGLDFTNVLPPKTGFMPWRVKISDDGRIFASSLDKNGVVVWEISKDLKTWTPVISGTNDATDYTIKKDDAFFAGLNVAMDVKGSGDELKLLLYSTNNKGIAFNQSGYRLDEYALGKATTFTGTPKNIIDGGKFAVVHTDVDFIYDGEGGYWFGGSRSGNAGQPNLVHIKADGTEDYRDETTTFYGGGGVLVHKGLLFKGLARTSSTDGNFGIYTIGKDANGNTTLTQKWTVTSTGLGRNHNAFAVDYAENLYVIGNSQEKIQVYALPYDGLVSTPAASKYAVTLNSPEVMSKASELNPYAYNLTSTFDNTNKVLTINYTLNANANSVDIVIKDGNLELKRIACSGKTRGSYTEVISVAGDNIPLNRKLSWSVEVKGTTKSVPTQVSTYYSLYCPHGLAIDKNPNSEYFGRILAAEGMQAVPASGYLSSSKGAGLYAFTPEFATDGKVYDGGLDFTRQLASNGYQPWRVKISEDGRIFVSSCDLNKVAVWEVSKDLSTWTKLIYRPNYSTSNYKQFTANGEFYCGPNVSMDVKGSGDNLKLLLYSTSKNGIGLNQNGYSLDEYAIGTSTDFTNGKPSHIACFDGKYGLVHTNVNVIYDEEGGYWFGASRAGNANQPNLVHFDKNGNRDYYSESAEFYGGDGVLVHNGMLIKGKARFDANTGQFGIYTIGKDASGNIKLTEKWAVKANHIGRNLNEFAVDFGENLYVVGNSGEKIIAFALPYSGTITTPCATQYEFTPLAGWVPSTTSDLNPFAYGLYSELIDGGMNLKINYSLNAPATTAQVIIMDGNTEVKAVACTDLTKGSHTITIPTEDLPGNTDLTWKIVVNGTSLDKVHEYATKHKFYHPSSVDVDNNPENETFGLVLVNEAMQKVKGVSGYLSTDLGAGIFAFNPAFENTGKYNGKRTFSTAANMFAPRRIRISDDGRIFATAQDGSGEYLWEVNTEDLNDWTTVFQGTNDGYTLKDGSGKFVAGTNAGFDVRGEGDNLQLLMLSASLPGAQVANFKCHIYNLGTASTWSTEPTKEVIGADYMLVTNQSNAQFDKDGGVWYIQFRGTTTEAEPGLVHINTSGVEDFKWLRNLTRNAGFRFNNDFTKVAIADNAFVNFYTVSKEGTGKPVLTWESGFSLATLGSNINDFAWDYANNFYAVSNTNEWAAAYRLPYSGEVTTPAASRYTFRVEYEVTVDENADNTTALTSFEGKTVTAKVVRNFTNNNYMTLTLPFDMNVAQVNQAFGSGNATIYTFASTQKDSEGTLELHFNTTTSIQAGHPYILKLNNAVNSFEVAGVTISTTPSDNEQDGITMHPVLDAGGTLNGATQYWLASDNYLYNAQTYSTAILGLRAIFDIPAGSRVRARAVFNSNETTDVVDLTPDQTTTPTVKKVLHKGQLIIIRGEEKYTIQGQRME